MNISNFMITQDYFIRTAMYKTRNTGTGNGMRGTRGPGGMLYSGECHQTFQEIYSNIPGNVLKHSGECRQTFRGISANIPGNVLFTLMVENWLKLHP